MPTRDQHTRHAPPMTLLYCYYVPLWWTHERYRPPEDGETMDAGVSPSVVATVCQEVEDLLRRAR